MAPAVTREAGEKGSEKGRAEVKYGNVWESGPIPTGVLVLGGHCELMLGFLCAWLEGKKKYKRIHTICMEPVEPAHEAHE